jgi:hypothetical protein
MASTTASRPKLSPLGESQWLLRQTAGEGVMLSVRCPFPKLNGWKLVCAFGLTQKGK